MNLNKEDTESIKNNVISIINSRLNGKDNANKISGTNVSDKLEEAQSTLSDKLTSDWNEFIDKISINKDKSAYYYNSLNALA